MRKRKDTRRLRRAAFNEDAKMLGERNGGCREFEEDAFMKKKRVRLGAKQQILLELDSERDLQPQTINGLGVPEYVPGKSFSSDWLFSEN